MILNFLDTLQKWIEPFRDFIFEHHNNPIFWIVIIGIVLAIFFLGYAALHKENQL